MDATDNSNTEITFIYCGYHCEGGDEYGPNIIFHYASKKIFEEPCFDLDYNYDLELWPRDKLYKYAGYNKNFNIKKTELPSNGLMYN
jgi:hypothetical protein